MRNNRSALATVDVDDKEIAASAYHSELNCSSFAGIDRSVAPSLLRDLKPAPLSFELIKEMLELVHGADLRRALHEQIEFRTAERDRALTLLARIVRIADRIPDSLGRDDRKIIDEAKALLAELR